MQEKRKKWEERVPELPKTKLVFLDGSGGNTNMARQYGRATGKQRVVDAMPLNTPQTQQACPPYAWTGSLPAP